MSALKFIALLLEFTMKVWGTMEGVRAAKRARNEKFELNEATFQAAVRKVLGDSIAQAPGLSAGAGHAQDAAEQAASEGIAPQEPGQGAS